MRHAELHPPTDAEGLAVDGNGVLYVCDYYKYIDDQKKIVGEGGGQNHVIVE